MKITCVKRKLKEAVGICERVTSKNINLPILNNVLFFADEKKMVLTATNLEIGVEIKVGAKVEKNGAAAAPAGVISGFLSNLQDEENITIESNNNNLLFLTKNSSVLVKGQPVDDFPALPKNHIKECLFVNVGIFVSGLRSVLYASSSSGIKPELSSVCVFSEDGKNMIFVATDSFRLAEKRVSLSVGKLNQILIPSKTVAEILRIFDGMDGDVKISSDKNQLFIETEDIVFVSRLVDGIFPDYKQIIPKNFTTDAIVDKNLFSGAIKTAAVFSGKLNECSVNVGGGEKFIVLKTSSSETGECMTKIPAQITGENVQVSFNYKYFADCFQFFNSRDMVLRFSGNNTPVLVSGTDDSSFKYLVMPMRSL